MATGEEKDDWDKLVECTSKLWLRTRNCVARKIRQPSRVEKLTAVCARKDDDINSLKTEVTELKKQLEEQRKFILADAARREQEKLREELQRTNAKMEGLLALLPRIFPDSSR